MHGAFRTPQFWIGEAAWGKAAVQYDDDTDTVYDAGRKQAALDVPLDGDGVVRAPLCLCVKDGIESVVLGTMGPGGAVVLHGVADLGRAADWVRYLEYDADAQTPYFALPVAELRPCA